MPVGVVMVLAMVDLAQQFLPTKVVLMRVGVVMAEMAERCPLTLVMFLVESGPGGALPPNTCYVPC